MAEINKINKKDGTVTGQQVPEETFFAGKTENPETEVPEEALVGTEEDVQAMMEKFDRESNTRHFAGIPQKIIRYCLVAFSLFCIYMNLIAVWDERTRRASFVGLLVLMAFALYPARKQDGRVKRLNHIPWYDGVLGILGSSCFFYFVFNVDRIVSRTDQRLRRVGGSRGYPDPSGSLPESHRDSDCRSGRLLYGLLIFFRYHPEKNYI